jgi:hypothetical protein
MGLLTAVSSFRKFSSSFDNFKESIQALGHSYKPFLYTIKALEPTNLQLWFPAILAHLDQFLIPSASYLEEVAPAFPFLTDGAYPKFITEDTQDFSPLVDMR